MAYTARTLITKAYYLSQIVARDYQTVSGAQITDGLELLNALLAIKSSDLRLIPYYQRDEFDTIAGTSEYFRENLLSIDSMTFNLGSVRYPMMDMSRKDFFNTPRVDNIQSLMYAYRAERELDGTRIYFYFVPDNVYPIKLSGKFALTSVTLDQDLSLTLDGFYLEYLRYALAEYICSDYGNTFPDQCAMKYAEIRKKLMDINPRDLTVRKNSYFNNQWGLDWQTINLSQGYLPY